MKNVTKIQFKPIGVIHTPFPEPKGIPIQPNRAHGVQGTVEVFPEYAEGLADLDGFSHIILLYHLHRVKEFRLKVVPFLDTVPRGVFATRAPRRPNPIGLSTVTLLRRENNILIVEGVDMVDGTPLLDIKPYIPRVDGRENCRVGWIENRQQEFDNTVADDRFSE